MPIILGYVLRCDDIGRVPEGVPQSSFFGRMLFNIFACLLLVLVYELFTMIQFADKPW